MTIPRAPILSSTPSSRRLPIIRPSGRSFGLQRRISITLPPDLPGRSPSGNPDAQRRRQRYRPRTKCFAAGSTLTLSQSDSTPSPPYLPLDDTDTFTAIDMDTNRSGLALVRSANQFNQAPRNQPPPALLPPALRSDGVFVAESGHNVLLRSARSRRCAQRGPHPQQQQQEHQTRRRRHLAQLPRRRPRRADAALVPAVPAAGHLHRP